MDYYAVEIRRDAGDEIRTFDGDELDTALIVFLRECDSDSKVSLIHVGEEYEEE